MANLFRLLRADEIECRVAQTGVGKNGGAWASILLYKDARVDQRILDETFGPMNWQAEYETIGGNLYCKLSVWDEKRSCWVSKQNVGSESDTEAEKGQASDALKRAAFTWGLGVELYSAPKICVALIEGECRQDNGKIKVHPSVTFKVADVEYDQNRRISYVVLVDKRGAIRYTFGKKQTPDAPAAQSPKIFYSKDGKKLIKGGKNWMHCIEHTANGNVMEDGTPIPVWIADYYNIPSEDMAEFTAAVVALRTQKTNNGHGNTFRTASAEAEHRAYAH